MISWPISPTPSSSPAGPPDRRSTCTAILPTKWRRDWRLTAAWDTKSRRHGIGACRPSLAPGAGSGSHRQRMRSSGEPDGPLAESLIPRTQVFVAVPSLDARIRGGRVSPLKGRIAKALRVLPIISLDHQGRSCSAGQAFSFDGAPQTVRFGVSVRLLHGGAAANRRSDGP